MVRCKAHVVTSCSFVQLVCYLFYLPDRQAVNDPRLAFMPLPDPCGDIIDTLLLLFLA